MSLIIDCDVSGYNVKIEPISGGVTGAPVVTDYVSGTRWTYDMSNLPDDWYVLTIWKDGYQTYVWGEYYGVKLGGGGSIQQSVSLPKLNPEYILTVTFPTGATCVVKDAWGGVVSKFS